MNGPRGRTPERLGRGSTLLREWALHGAAPPASLADRDGGWGLKTHLDYVKTTPGRRGLLEGGRGVALCGTEQTPCPDAW